ncbi:tetratricopeptide repeat protein [Planktothrix agardhii]|uniref:tetratricopeptide repeat protein n=1 Tax=Planktothrix agardhii TaxID=1160 RepID=UPI0004004892|nr:tetratricopeptide repeat protein [Planktothrix agardhii]CAD0226745.1 hypothetical protein PL10110_290044 [Planktothrix agardhii]CAD5963517.1 Tetratricopeptide repeat protein 28 [Planktothrix agardhii]
MNRQALVVGINRYLNLDNLKRPAFDAEAIAHLLETYGGFKVRRLPAGIADQKFKVNPKPGYGEEEVDIKVLEEEILQLFGIGEKDCPDTALLFFAGHGLRKPRGLKEGFLATSDTNPEQELYGLALNSLRDILLESNVKQQIIWLDCCHGGQFIDVLNKADPGSDRCCIASCSASEIAYATGEHGLLTSILLQGLDPYQCRVGEWIDNLSLAAFFKQQIQTNEYWRNFPQRPVFNNSGGAIQLIQGVKIDQEETVSTLPPTIAIKEKTVVGIDALRTVPVWVGRDDLLQQLKDKLVSPETLLKMLVLVGQGGIGKSSLAAKLLEALGANLTTATLAPDSIYNGAICFKAEEGSSFDEVAGFLLRGLQIDVNETITDATHKINLILTGLRQQRSIILLDNLESILYPASHPQAGNAILPEWGKLLNAFAYGNHCSQVIITSREIPADLGDGQSAKVVFDSVLVHIETLLGVDVAAGIELLWQRQLRDSEEDLRWITERVGGHAFLLTQLANLGKDKPGYLRQHPELVTEKAEPILKAQLARQGKKARDLLRRMCVLRVGINIRGLTFLRLYNDGQKDFWDLSVSNLFRKPVCKQPHKLTSGEINQTKLIVERLVESSLVQSRYDEQTGEDLYSLHRLIVEFLQGTYYADIPHLLKSVYAFYQAGKQVKNPKNLEDLRPVLEAQYFAFQLGNYREASSLLMWTLEKYLRLWGHWTLLKDLYEQILPYVDDDEIAWYKRDIGSIYRDTGNWDLAEKYFQDALAIEEKKQNKSGMATSWGMLGYIESCRGNWDGAEALYRQCLEVETELRDRAGMAATWASLGYIESCRGNWDGAEALYRQSLEVRTELGDRAGMASSWGVLGDIERMRGKWDEAEALYRQCLEVETELGDQSGIATSIGCLGENELRRGNLDAAEKLLREALAKVEDLGITYKIAEANYDLAQLERRRGNTEIAQQHYDTAHQIFVQLGAAKQLERIEREWALDDKNKEE